MESVLRIAESGQGYLAVERSNIVIRAFKRQGKLDEAMMFLMQLANKLADVGQWQSATVAALRSVELFPTDAKTIKVILKQEFENFAKRVNNPDAATNEFYQYIEKLTEIIGDPHNELFAKTVELAFSAKQFYNVQFFVFRGISNIIDQDTPEIDVSKYIEMLVQASWNWINSLPEDDKEFTGQYIIGRIYLAFISLRIRGIELYTQVSKVMKEKKPENIPENFLNQPLFHLVELLKKAFEAKNKTCVDKAVNNYMPLLDVDEELKKWIKAAKTTYFEPQQGEGPGLGGLFQMFGNMMQPPNRQ